MAENEQKSGSGAFVWVLLALVIVGIGAAYIREVNQPEPLPVLSTVRDFQLTNQLGHAVSMADLDGDVVVADVIFSRCPTSCLTLSKKFGELQKRLPEGKKVRLISLTIDPEFDTPEVLERYGKKFNADPDKWWFLTGDNSVIRRLAIHDFRFVVLDSDPKNRVNEDDLFVHSTYFMVMDKKGQVRKVIETLDPQGQADGGPSTIDETLDTVNQLLNE